MNTPAYNEHSSHRILLSLVQRLHQTPQHRSTRHRTTPFQTHTVHPFRRTRLLTRISHPIGGELVRAPIAKTEKAQDAILADCTHDGEGRSGLHPSHSQMQHLITHFQLHQPKPEHPPKRHTQEVTHGTPEEKYHLTVGHQ